MIIYTILPADRSEFCHPVDGEFGKISSQLKGESRIATWEPIQMELVHEDQGRWLRESDSPWLGSHALIFRAKAVSALGTLLSDNGELLFLICPEAELWVFNVTSVLDALDWNASSIIRTPQGIPWIRRHVFKPHVVQDVDVFKITGVRVSQTFVSERFVQKWESEGLKGLEFTEAWRSPENKY